MPRPASKHPTELELEILKILWKEPPLSGREIRDALAPTRDLTYASVMTMLGIMEEKAYVSRKKVDGAFVYSPKITQKAASRRMLRDLVDRVFEGSVATAALHLLETSRLDAGELRQLNELIQRKNEEERR